MGQPSPVRGVDPSTVSTPRELRACLRGLKERRGLSYSELDRLARELLPRDGRAQRLPSSTLGDLLADNDSAVSKDVFLALLATCAIGADDEPLWLAAWERASTAHLTKPAGAVRVGDANPRLLGVHAAIQVDGAAGEVPPYVPRDLDAGLRTAVTAASVSGGFVLLTGGSSVGKTRALYEAVRAVIAEWWLLHPADTVALRAFADQPTPRTVVWLDELQRYLNHPGGLPAGVVRSLVTAGVVVVATLWPDEYGTRTAPRIPGQPDPYVNDRELLGLARVITVPEVLSRAERRRAENLAADVRIRTALDTPDAGFTQVLAAGPALINHWANAPAHQCYGKAVITAALDARRVGATAAITREFLAAAAPAYLAPAQQATAPTDWLDQALIYATTQLRGAASALVPVPAGLGRIGGYTAADYLHQHAQRARRTIALPDQVWKGLVDHHHPDDTARLATEAKRRGRPDEATALYRLAGDGFAAVQIAGLLAEQGRIDDAIAVLQAPTDASDVFATNPLAKEVVKQLVKRLVKQRRVAELRVRADAGDVAAANRLAKSLAEQDNFDLAIKLFLKLADVEGKDPIVTAVLPWALIGRGRFNEGFALMWPSGDAGDVLADIQLVGLLAEQGRIDELTAEVAAGTPTAADALQRIVGQGSGSSSSSSD